MPEGPILRAATVADLRACADIVNDHIDALAWLPRRASRRTVEEAFHVAFADGRNIMVAEADGRVIGYSSVEPREGRPAHLHALYLRPAYRRQGIGKRLLDMAKARFAEGFELTVFEPNGKAKRFYEREGLVEDETRRDDETEEGVPTLMMVWRGAQT